MIRVEKPWGRTRLWPGFDNPAPGAAPVGEIWFDGGNDAPLLVKYLFTSERLSIQVHPDDDQARASGHGSGKDEAWIILAAEPNSTIALGTKAPESPETLRAAALDGSIENLLDWRPVNAGDVIYSPAGTIHAIGAGITLVEVQQNIDLTYRLYDYGRPRELHLEEGMAVALAFPFVADQAPVTVAPGHEILASGGKFVVERRIGDGAFECNGEPLLLIPLSGSGSIDDTHWRAGECWSVDGKHSVWLAPGAELLIAYEGPTPRTAAE